ncbi:hypothetical protein AAG906_028491 [Vitis piasezkii]
MEMNGDKAPGLDGFTVAFWQSCWEFVKEEVLDMFKEFYEQNSFFKSLNNTFLVLLPKKRGAEDLGDYRPISLLRGLYKLLAKVLANRLKKMIGNVVSSDLNAFCKKWGLGQSGWDGCGVGVLSLSVAFGEVVYVDKENGRLGLRKLARLNKALLGKWIWRFACAKKELWKKVLEAKYGQEDFGWRTRKTNGATKSDFGQTLGAGVMCCPKVSRIFLPWLPIGMPRWKRCGTRILAKVGGI